MMQAAAAAAERRARDNVWCPCSSRGDFLSAEDAIIVEDMSTPAPCASGSRAAPPAPDGAPAPGGQDHARRSGSAAAPQEIVDLTLSDDDDVQPAASRGAHALAPAAGAAAGSPRGASQAVQDGGAGIASGVAAPELLQNGPKRQRSDAEAKAARFGADTNKGRTGAVIQLGASAQSVSGAERSMSAIPGTVNVAQEGSESTSVMICCTCLV